MEAKKRQNLINSAYTLGGITGLAYSFAKKKTFWGYVGFMLLGSIVVGGLSTVLLPVSDSENKSDKHKLNKGDVGDKSLNFTAKNVPFVPVNAPFKNKTSYLSKTDCVNSGGILIDNGRQCKWGRDTAMIDEF
jgi:hypothetical protein